MNFISLKKNSGLLVLILLFFLPAYLLFYLFPVHREFDGYFEKVLFSLRYRIKGKEKISSRLCVFNIDDQDVETLGIKPYDRALFSRLIKILKKSKAKTVLFDLFFKDQIDLESDSELARTSKEAGFIFYPLSLQGYPETEHEKELIKKITLEPKVVKKGSPYNSDFFKVPFPALTESSRGLGTIALRPGNDAISRRLPLLFTYKNRNEYIPSLVLIGLCHFLGADPESMEVTFGKHIKLTGSTDTKTELYIPIDSRGTMAINFCGPWINSVENYSLRDIFYLYEEDPELLEELLEDTLVLVSDISSGKKDYSTGIFESYYPNSGILSNALNTMLTGNYLREPGLIFTLLSSVLFLLLLYLAASRWKTPGFTLFFTGCFLLYLLLVTLLFFYLNILPRISLQLSGLFFSFPAILFYKGKKEKTLDIKTVDAEHMVIKREEFDKLTKIAAVKIDEKACRKYEITPAQRKLLKVLQQGHTYKKAGLILGIQESTVKNQVLRIKEKSGIYQKKDLLELFFPLGNTQ